MASMDHLTPSQVDTRRLPDGDTADLSELTEAADEQVDPDSRTDRPLPKTLTEALCHGSRRLAMTDSKDLTV